MRVKVFYWILSVSILFNLTGFAQQNTVHPVVPSIKNYEDSLKRLAYLSVNDNIEANRKNAGYAFIKTLVKALKTEGSFQYPFDSLKSVSIVKSPDDRFRIMAWHILNQDGSYRFYGAIQMNTPRLVLFPLEDYSAFLSNPEDSIVNNRKWYGAQYYKVVPVEAAKPYYILLGWKGNTEKSTKKVIDVLSFNNGKPEFGLPVFDGNGKTRSRIVFEYTRQASMLLRYNEVQKLIVFDHLAPPEQKLTNKFENYGPDLTYSGYRLRNGRWQYADNLDMRNIPENRDQQFIDPKIQAAKDKAALGSKKTR